MSDVLRVTRSMRYTASSNQCSPKGKESQTAPNILRVVQPLSMLLDNRGVGMVGPDWRARDG